MILTSQDPLILIPNVPMTMILGNAVTFTNLVSTQIPEVYPNYMTVDYVRVFQRPNFAVADPVFTINDQKSTNSASPIQVSYSTLPIKLNASESYMPNHNYYIALQQYNGTTGALIGNEVGGWYNNISLAAISAFDLKTLAQTYNFPLFNGNYYRVRVGGGSPVVSINQYIHLMGCGNTINFTINGKTAVFPTPINFAYNYGSPNIMLDASISTACSDIYFLSVQEFTSTGTPITGTDVSRWLTAAEIKTLNKFDLRAFYASQSRSLDYGHYYGIKVATGNPWTEKIQLIRLMPCTSVVNFKLDGAVLAPPPAINNFTAMQPLIMDGSSFCTLCNDNFFVEIVESNSAGVPLTNAIALQEWVSLAQMYVLNIGAYDFRDLCRRNNYTLECNKYYRIKLATGPIWTEVAYILHAPTSCTNSNNSFTLVRDAFSIVPDGTCLNLINHSYTVYAPNSFSCNYSFYLAVQEWSSGVLVGPQAGGWLTAEQIHQVHDYGVLDLEVYAQAGGLTMSNGHFYQIKFVANNGSCNASGWVENLKVFNCSGTCGGREREAPLVNSQAGLMLFPNPASNTLNVQIVSDQEHISVEIIDLMGQVVLRNSDIENNTAAIDIRYPPSEPRLILS